MTKTVLENYHLHCDQCAETINAPFCACEREGFTNERDFIRPHFDGLDGLDVLVAEEEQRQGRTLDVFEIVKLAERGIRHDD